MISPQSRELFQQANALVRSGRAKEAEDALRKLVRKNPKWDQALYLMGLYEIQRGDRVKAEQWYRKALSCNPNLPDALADLGQLYFLRSEYGEAEKLYRRTLALAPNTPLIQSFLAVSLANLDRVEEAETLARAALAKIPHDPTASYSLGQVLRAGKKWAEAIDVFKATLALDPNHLQALTSLLKIAEQINVLPDCRSHLERAMALDPEDGDLALMSVFLLQREKKTDEAIAKLDHFISSFSNQLRNALSRREGLTQAKTKDKEALRQASSDCHFLPIMLSRFYYERGRLHDVQRRTDAAYQDFLSGNSAVQMAFPDWREGRDGFLRTVENLDQAFRVTAFDFWTAPSATPETSQRPRILFEVGFPRSGTTLLEAILDVHPDCAAMDETNSFNAALLHMNTLGKRYPEDLDRLTADDIQALRDLYFTDAAKNVDTTGKAWLIDKNPLNIIHAGFIRRVFPEAKILVMLRHPFDCGLSCFMQNFQPNDGMCNFFTLDDTFRLYDKVFTLWELYASLLPPQVALTLRYEDLVADRETVVAKMLSWMGLSWSSDVLDHSAKGQLKTLTPSYRQINQPVHAKAVDRWRRYEAYIRPFAAQLAPHLKAFGYESALNKTDGAV